MTALHCPVPSACSTPHPCCCLCSPLPTNRWYQLAYCLLPLLQPPLPTHQQVCPFSLPSTPELEPVPHPSSCVSVSYSLLPTHRGTDLWQWQVSAELPVPPVLLGRILAMLCPPAAVPSMHCALALTLSCLIDLPCWPWPPVLPTTHGWQIRGLHPICCVMRRPRGLA